MDFLVSSDQRIRLKGDSITIGYGFGNYTTPSPLRSIHGMARILLQDNLAHPPSFDALPIVWLGSQSNGMPVRVESMADEIRLFHSDGRLLPGDWLIFEEAGETDKTVHGEPWPWTENIYNLLRESFREMALAAEPIIGLDHIVFMTMFDYCERTDCQWDRLLDDGIHTGNDAFRDEAAALGIKLIDMNRIMDAAQDYLISSGWGKAVGPDDIHPNVYGNYIMLLAILDCLGADVSQWRLDGLYQYFKHPENGGDVPTVWGFDKDPTDYERLLILHDLRNAVLDVVHPDRIKKSYPGIKRMFSHGRVLSHPVLQPEGTKLPVSYELGHMYQLDKDNCLFVASLREMGGWDFCVGNDGIIISSLSDIKAEDAFPINRPDTEYKLKSGKGGGTQAKFPARGAFVPLGAKLEDGTAHPAAGTGFLISHGVTYLTGESKFHPEADNTQDLIQLSWDGVTLRTTAEELPEVVLGLNLIGDPITDFAPHGEGYIAPFTAAGKGQVMIKFGWNGESWQPLEHGEPFHDPSSDAVVNSVQDYCVANGEIEGSVQRCPDGYYYVETRGMDGLGRFYRSKDGMNYEFICSIPNHTVPQPLNMGLDGSLYVASNTGPGWLRNPLIAQPLEGDHYGDPILIHDHKGIHDDQGKEVPFIDHGVAKNVWLDGRWRHFIFYRMCDLRETNGEGAPPTTQTGIYIAEIEYEKVIVKPTIF